MQPAIRPVVKLFKVQLSRWRLVRDLGIHLLDVTAKSGNPAFAPRFDDVMAYKRGELSEEEYTRRYLQRMSISKKRFPQEWEKLKAIHLPIAVACYCKAGVFCHRHLFVGIAADYLKDAGIDVKLMYEITSLIPPQTETPPDDPTDTRSTTPAGTAGPPRQDRE
ncbi:hypothetical protein [Paraburkholderia sp. BCC1886]|uniref:hypothetical protein n=1 Tax=Paraburkholderia sp. BCC1886 TaxID=2562670 RepID=UPI0011834DD3|nr:hypothetical protein [Paraburkholderia sp. BCC1886]